MRPQIHRRNAMRRKRYLLTNAHTTVNTGSSQTPPRVDPVFAYRARARALDDNFAKLIGLDEGVPNEPRVQAQAQALFYEWGLVDFANMDHIAYVNGKRRKVFLFWYKNRRNFFFVEIVFFNDQPPLVRRSLGIHSREFADTLYYSTGPSWLPFERLYIPGSS